MTTIDINELPVAELGRRGRDSTVPTASVGTSRRDLISYTVRGAAFIGLFGLSLFRSARKAGAENPPWNEFTSCGPYDPGDHTPCYDNMCVGTSLELMDNFFCTIDCNQVDANNTYQWHRNKVYGQFGYRDYPGDICAVSNPARDAWWWSVGRCGSCNPAIYRCHDGQKRTEPNGEWAFTICEGLARCSGGTLTCP
jgi:hypothetical protein